MRRRWLTPFGAAIAACSSGNVVFTESPALEGAQSYILAIDRVHASELRAGVLGDPAIRFELTREPQGEAKRVELLLYEESLDTLGLIAGELLSAQPSEEPGALPRPKRVLRGSVGEPLEVVPEMSESLAQFRYSRGSKCAEWDVQDVVIQATGIASGAWLGSGALLLSLGTVFYRVDRQGAAPLEGCGRDGTITSVSALGEQRFAFYAVSSTTTPGVVGIVTIDEAQLRCETTFRQEVPIFAASAVEKGPEGAGDSLFILTSTGAFYAFGSRGLELIHQLEPAPYTVPASASTELVWIGGHTLVGHYNGPQVLSWSAEGGVRERSFPPTSLEPEPTILGIAPSDDGAVLVATSWGDIDRILDAGQGAITHQRVVVGGVRGFVPFGDGFFISVVAAPPTQYYRTASAFEPCPTGAVASRSGSIIFSIATEDRVVLVYRDEGHVTRTVVWLTVHR